MSSLRRRSGVNSGARGHNENTLFTQHAPGHIAVPRGFRVVDLNSDAVRRNPRTAARNKHGTAIIHALEPCVAQHALPATPITPRARGVANVLRHAFVPDASTVATEYWHHRSLCLVEMLLDAVRGALTAHAWYIAVGVGKEGATPFGGIVVQEINAIASHTIGLALSSFVRSSTMAAHARSIVLIDYLLAVIMACFALALLAAPAYLQAITLAEAVLGAVKNVATVPAHAALWAHMQRSKDSRTRAEVSRKNANQNFVLKLVCLGLRYSVLIWVNGSLELATLVFVPLTVLITVVRGMKIRGVIPTDLNHQRLRLALVAHGRSEPVNAAAIAKAEPLLRSSFARAPRWDVTRLAVGVPLQDVLVMVKPTFHSASGGGVSGVSGHDSGSGGYGGSRSGSGSDPSDDGDILRPPAVQLLQAQQHLPFVLGANVRACCVTLALKEGCQGSDLLRAGFLAHLIGQRLAHEQSQLSGSATRGLSAAVVVRTIRRVLVTKSRDAAAFVTAVQQAGLSTSAAMLCAGDWRLVPVAQPAASASHSPRQTWTVVSTAPQTQGGVRARERMQSADGVKVLRVCSPHQGITASGRVWTHTTATTSTSTKTQATSTSEGGGASVGACGSVLRRVLASMLLPRGYPESVATEYTT